MSTVTFLVAVAAIVFAISFMRSATHADWTGDAQVVAQLRKAGSDLSKPHPVEFFSISHPKLLPIAFRTN